LRIFQTLALVGYSAVRRSGLTSTRPGAAVFVFLYNLYKEVFEGREVARLCGLVEPGTVVIDVGANIGFFTVRLARRVGDLGKVIAFEPESCNFLRLRAAVARAGLTKRVELVQAAVAEATGQVTLVLNPDNPADHRLGEGGVPVIARCLDDELSRRGWPPVSLVKIDVQGAESRVLAGAGEMLDRLRPALFLEVDIATSGDEGRGIVSLLHSLQARGYAGYRLASSKLEGPLSIDAVIEIAKRRGYADFLFLGDGDTRAPAPRQGE
jgi:FkbM family methyltransferase